MKKILYILLLAFKWVVFIFALVILLFNRHCIRRSAVYRKVIQSFPNGNTEITYFYRKKRKIAEQFWDNDQNVIKTIGTIPDGEVIMYYNYTLKNSDIKGIHGKLFKLYYNNSIKHKFNYKNNMRNGEAKERNAYCTISVLLQLFRNIRRVTHRILDSKNTSRISS